MIIEFEIGNGIKVKFDLVQIAMLLTAKPRVRKHYRRMLKDQLDSLEIDNKSLKDQLDKVKVDKNERH